MKQIIRRIARKETRGKKRKKRVEKNWGDKNNKGKRSRDEIEMIREIEKKCYNLRLRVKSKKLYKDYIRELNRFPSTKCLSYIHLANGLY